MTPSTCHTESIALAMPSRASAPAPVEDHPAEFNDRNNLPSRRTSAWSVVRRCKFRAPSRNSGPQFCRVRRDNDHVAVGIADHLRREGALSRDCRSRPTKWRARWSCTPGAAGTFGAAGLARQTEPAGSPTGEALELRIDLCACSYDLIRMNRDRASAFAQCRLGDFVGRSRGFLATDNPSFILCLGFAALPTSEPFLHRTGGLGRRLGRVEHFVTSAAYCLAFSWRAAARTLPFLKRRLIGVCQRALDSAIDRSHLASIALRSDAGPQDRRDRTEHSLVRRQIAERSFHGRGRSDRRSVARRRRTWRARNAACLGGSRRRSIHGPFICARNLPAAALRLQDRGPCPFAPTETT